MFTPEYLPLYRVRVTSGDPGYRLIDFGRKMFSAKREAATINEAGGTLDAVVEAYDRFTGATLRQVKTRYIVTEVAA